MESELLMVTVRIGKREYKKTRKEADKLLEMAKERVPVGIYGLEINNVLVILTDRMTKTRAKKQRRQYMNAGFKVYASGL